MALDTLHIVIGAAVVVMAVISFINPEEYMFSFRSFLLAAILNLVTGKYRYKRSVRNQKKRSHPRFRWRLEEPGGPCSHQRSEHLVEVEDEGRDP